MAGAHEDAPLSVMWRCESKSSQVAVHDGDSEFAVEGAKKFAGLQGHKATGRMGPQHVPKC